MRDTVVSITFSSSEKKWCFFFIIIATRRKRRTQRDSETRERNEEKRTFCDRKTDELRIVAGFIIRDRSDDAFGTTSEKKYSFTFYSIIARRREAEEEPIARARAFFSFFSYLRYKNEKRDRRAQTHNLSFVIRDRSDDAFGPISKTYSLSSSSLDVEKPKKNP